LPADGWVRIHEPGDGVHGDDINREVEGIKIAATDVAKAMSAEKERKERKTRRSSGVQKFKRRKETGERWKGQGVRSDGIEGGAGDRQGFSEL
jgi:hypothetical protein